MSVIIQNLAFRKDLQKKGADRSLFFDGSYAEIIGTSPAGISIKAGHVVSTGTHYNAFPLSRWCKYCGLANLQFFLYGAGRVWISAYIRGCDGSEILLSSMELMLGDDLRYNNLDLKGNRKGLVLLRVTAMTDAVISGGGFATHDESNAQVKLGVVVTHFNQLESVKNTIRAFGTCSCLKSLPVKLVVVDNSSNIPAQYKLDNVEIVQNANYGGSGGYARGKLFLEDGEYTHCIFMDDDVGVDPECVFRVFRIFEFAKIDFSVVGTIISKGNGRIVLQTGGRYSYGFCWEPVGSGLDLGNIDGVAQLDQSYEDLDFGAFPFYAFSLASIKSYPFPFFVRGDDVLFGLHEPSVKKIAWPGISVLISFEDLITKETPHTLYQDCRALMAIELMSGSRSSLHKLLRVFVRIAFYQIFSYKYASAEAVQFAAKNVMEGPAFFERDLDQAAIRNRDKPLCAREMFVPCAEPKNVDHAPPCRHGRLFRWLTINGLLLPRFLMTNRLIAQPQGFKAELKDIYGYRFVCYESLDGKRWVAEHKKAEIFLHLIKSAVIVTMLVIRYPWLKRAYGKNVARITGKSFWQAAYGLC